MPNFRNIRTSIHRGGFRSGSFNRVSHHINKQVAGAHFFLTVDLSIKLERLKATIREKLRCAGLDQNIREIIPDGLVIQDLAVLWNTVVDVRFSPRTFVNDRNIEPLLLYMKEGKIWHEVVDVET